MQIMNLFLWFISYSFIGWAWETLLFTFQEKRIVNRGFLNGPFCPIYGIGALLLIWSLSGRTVNIFVLFLAALVLTTALEYVTGYLMEKLFNAKWWDYSMFPLNFQGRISLVSSLFFAFGAVLLVLFIHPFVIGMTDRLTVVGKQIILFVFIIYFFIDFSITTRHVLILNGRLSEIQAAINCFFGKYARRAGEFKNTIFVNFEESEFYSDRIRTLLSLDRLQNTRIFKAFPKLQSIKYDDALRKLKDKLMGSRGKDGNGE